MRAVVLNPGGRKITMRKKQRKTRRRRRNPLWRARSGRYTNRKTERKLRRGKGSRTCGWANNPRHKKRARYKYSAKRRRRNPIAYNCKMAYNGVNQTLKTIPDVLPLVGGAALNGILANFVASQAPQLQAGPLAIATRFGGAVALGIATRMFAPKYASGVAKGALLNMVTKTLTLYGPSIGMGDFATVRQVQAARSIDGSI